MRNCLFADTAPDPCYPPYISINRNADGSIEFTVRNPSYEASMGFIACGATASYTLTPEQAADLKGKL